MSKSETKHECYMKNQIENTVIKKNNNNNEM